MRKSYPSDIKPEQFEVIKPLLESARRKTAPRKVDLYEVFCAVLYLHVHSTETPDDRGQAVIDIFRVQQGKLVEHWDVIQDVPAESANQNTMF